MNYFKINWWIVVLLFTTLLHFNAHAQYTNIPDANFRTELSNLNVTFSGNSALTSDLEALTTLDVSGASISDLTGIEACINLTELFCYNNSLSGDLDISNNLDLVELNCSNNNLTSLTFANQDLDLVKLFFYDNDIHTLNNISNAIKLEKIAGQKNDLTSFDASDFPDLETLTLDQNDLTSITFSSNNSTLWKVKINKNSLTSVNVSGLNGIDYLDCSDNSLTSITLNNNLEELYCQVNSISTLSISSLTQLLKLSCSNNNFGNLDISGASNLNYLKADNNSSLTCITATSTQITNEDVTLMTDLDDATQYLGTSCQQNKIGNFSDDGKFENINIYPIPNYGIVYFNSNNKIKSVIVYNSNGQQLNSYDNLSLNKINLSYLNSGFYILWIRTTDNQFEKIKYVKN